MFAICNIVRSPPGPCIVKAERSCILATDSRPDVAAGPALLPLERQQSLWSNVGVRHYRGDVYSWVRLADAQPVRDQGSTGRGIELLAYVWTDFGCVRREHYGLEGGSGGDELAMPYTKCSSQLRDLLTLGYRTSPLSGPDLLVSGQHVRYGETQTTRLAGRALGGRHCCCRTCSTSWSAST